MKKDKVFSNKFCFFVAPTKKKSCGFKNREIVAATCENVILAAAVLGEHVECLKFMYKV